MGRNLMKTGVKGCKYMDMWIFATAAVITQHQMNSGSSSESKVGRQLLSVRLARSVHRVLIADSVNV
ncbi:unnamed protein product, partial [Iphiclides podalirius]